MYWSNLHSPSKQRSATRVYQRTANTAAPAATGGNAYATKMDSAFSGGFGPWALDQCVHRRYKPSILAFSGPSAWEDDIVQSCPPADFCACDEIRDHVHTLLFNRSSLSERERSDLYWASLAPGFTVVSGLTSVSGGSWEHFDLVYEHSDGRRQVCSGAQRFTYSPQSGSTSPTPDWGKVARENKREAEYMTGCKIGVVWEPVCRRLPGRRGREVELCVATQAVGLPPEVKSAECQRIPRGQKSRMRKKLLKRKKLFRNSKQPVRRPI